MLGAKMADIRSGWRSGIRSGLSPSSSARPAGSRTGCVTRWVDQRSGNWQPRRPDPKLYQTTTQPEDRSDILVAAVFKAFRKIYTGAWRTTPTRQPGHGELPVGSLHPDLVNRLTSEAARSAAGPRHVPPGP